MKLFCSVLFSDDEVEEATKAAPKKKKEAEGGAAIKGQSQAESKANPEERKRRPPKVYANRTLNSFTTSPQKQRKHVTNKKVRYNFI